jgi:hypothetical protein
MKAVRAIDMLEGFSIDSPNLREDFFSTPRPYLDQDEGRSGK